MHSNRKTPDCKITARQLFHLRPTQCLILCCIVAAFSLPVHAQKTTLANEVTRIISLETAWNGAEVNHDVRSLEMLIADTFVYTDSDGSFLYKDQWLAQVKNETEQYQQLANTDVAVVVYENAAVVTGQYREKIQIKGKWVTRTGRFTDTWIRRNGEWKCVASQATLIDR